MQEQPTAKDELIALVKEKVLEFLLWLKPVKEDAFLLKVIKMVFKVPIALFVLLLSPVLMLILGIAFVVMI